MMLRVCHVCSSLSQGGLARVVVDLGAEPMKGVELSLIATAFPGVHWPERGGAWARRTVIQRRSKLARYGELFRLFRSWKPQVVHSHHEAYAPIIARCARVPVRVETIHNATAWRSLGHPLVHAARRRCVTRYVAVSDGLRSQLVGDGILPAASVVALPNGVSVGPSLLSRPLRNPITIGTVARFDREKGLEFLLDAFASLRPSYPGARLLLVGDGPSRSALAAHIAALGLNGAVILPGYVADTRAFLRRMDLFVLPSLDETFGLALAEAMAEGVPVVASDLPGPASLCGHEREGLLVPPGDAAAIADACRRLLDDPNLRARLTHAAYNRVKSEFSLERTREAHRELYLSLLGHAA
ncbi:MAG: glycosyltransferase [Armatimonadota bacterium]|nr:glycosyltransferase [Armatimonadota bacterium]